MLLSELRLEPRALASAVWSSECVPELRLWHRLLKVVALLFLRFDDPTTRLPRAPRRGAQRFWDNPRVSATSLLRSAQRPAFDALAAHATVLVAHDTTEVNRTGPNEPDDAGPLRSNTARGYLVHSAVALTVDEHRPLGVLDTQVWTRSWKLKQQDHKHRPNHQRESIKWRRGIRRVAAEARERKLPTTLIHLMDREGDVHANFEFARRHKHLVVVRAAHDHRVRGSTGMLWSTLQARPVASAWSQSVRNELSNDLRKQARAAGRDELDALEAAHKRAGPRREAQLQLRFASVTLENTKKGKKAVEVAAILVQENNAPAGSEAVEWMVLTTCEVSEASQARAVMKHYEARYGIEPVHRIWKSGLHLESETVANVESFRRLMSVYVPLATQIARWTYVSRETPRAPAAPHVAPRTLAILKEACRFRKIALPRRAWTIEDLVMRLAQLGGYEPRPDRKPGWIVIWRGWRELQRFEAIFNFAKSSGKQDSS